MVGDGKQAIILIMALSQVELARYMLIDTIIVKLVAIVHLHKAPFSTSIFS